MLTSRQVFDLFILGLEWHSRRNSRKARRATGIFYALKRLGLIKETRRRSLAVDPELLELFWKASHIYSEERVRGAKLAALVEETDKLFIVLARTDRPDRKRLLGANGYFIVLTAAGQQRAAELEQAYGRYANEQSFLEAWSAATLLLGRQMAAIEGANNAGKVQSAGSSSKLPTSIPRAPDPQGYDW